MTIQNTYIFQYKVHVTHDVILIFDLIQSPCGNIAVGVSYELVLVLYISFGYNAKKLQTYYNYFSIKFITLK